MIDNGDGSIHQELADQLAGRREDGSYDNSQAVLFLVNCADDPKRPSKEFIKEAVDKVADQLLISGRQYVAIRVALDSKSQSTHCL